MVNVDVRTCDVRHESLASDMAEIKANVRQLNTRAWYLVCALLLASIGFVVTILTRTVPAAMRHTGEAQGAQMEE